MVKHHMQVLGHLHICDGNVHTVLDDFPELAAVVAREAQGESPLRVSVFHRFYDVRRIS